MFHERLQLLKNDTTLIQEFKQEMYRFLSQEQIKAAIEKDNMWKSIIGLMEGLHNQLHKNLK
jgi:hypothetical protein